MNADEQTELARLEKEISLEGGESWESVKSLVGLDEKAANGRRRSTILLYAHLLRLEVRVPSLQAGTFLCVNISSFSFLIPFCYLEQAQVILQTPALLNALIAVTTSRNWLVPTIYAMRLYAFITQAILPQNFTVKPRLAQLPGIKYSEVVGENASIQADDVKDVATQLEQKGDGRADDVKKAVDKWGRLEIVDAAYKGAHNMRIVDLRANTIISHRRTYCCPLFHRIPGRQA